MVSQTTHFSLINHFRIYVLFKAFLLWLLLRVTHKYLLELVFLKVTPLYVRATLVFFHPRLNILIFFCTNLHQVLFRQFTKFPRLISIVFFEPLKFLYRDCVTSIGVDLVKSSNIYVQDQYHDIFSKLNVHCSDDYGLRGYQLGIHVWNIRRKII